MSSFAQRRSSGLGVRTVSTPRSVSSQHSRRSSDTSGRMSPVTPNFYDSNEPLGGGATLGASLADEMADWDEGAEEVEADDETSGASNQASNSATAAAAAAAGGGGGGGEGGDNDDDLVPTQGFSPFLEKSMADIEALARHNVDSVDGIWERAIAQLRDLPPQMELENNAARLNMANAAAAADLEGASKAWPQVAQLITTPWATMALPLDLDTLDDLEVLVSGLVDTLPRPRPPADTLDAVRLLNSDTHDVLAVLTAVADQLHMQKQASAKAAQKLKAAKDVVVALKKDFDLGEQGAAWLESGRWNERIKAREAARVCEDVVGGFEEVCNSWRDKLVEKAGEVATPSTGAVDVSAA